MSGSARRTGFRKLECMIVAFAALILSAPASAELLCGEPIHEVNYDGCILPNDPNQEYQWEIGYPGSSGTPYVDTCGDCQDDCQLVIPVAYPHDYFVYERYEPALETAESYSLEARVRAEDFYLVGTRLNANVAIKDGQKYAHIYFHHHLDTGEITTVRLTLQ